MKLDYLPDFILKQNIRQIKSDLKNLDSINGLLYKYYPLSSTFTLSNLQNNIIHYSKPNFFNDPFDCFCGYNSKTYIQEILIGLLFDNRFNLDSDLQEFFCKFILQEELKEKELNLIQEFLNKYTQLDLYSDTISYDDKIRELLKLFINEQDEEIINIFTKYCESDCFQNKMNEAINNVYAITCFCESHTDALMWSHYADKHKGICVEYNFKMLAESNPILNTLFPVEYSKFRPCLPTGVTLDESNQLKINLPKMNAYHIIKNLITKSDIWKNEKEWRSINWLSELDNNQNIELPIISKVFLGANIDLLDKQKVERICICKGIPTIQMKLSKYKYELIEN